MAVRACGKVSSSAEGKLISCCSPLLQNARAGGCDLITMGGTLKGCGVYRQQVCVVFPRKASTARVVVWEKELIIALLAMWIPSDLFAPKDARDCEVLFYF